MLLVACCSGKDASDQPSFAIRETSIWPTTKGSQGAFTPRLAAEARSTTTCGDRGSWGSCVCGGDTGGDGCGGGSTRSYGPPSVFIIDGGGFKGARNSVFQLSSSRSIDAFQEQKQEVTANFKEPYDDMQQGACTRTGPGGRLPLVTPFRP